MSGTGVGLRVRGEAADQSYFGFSNNVRDRLSDDPKALFSGFLAGMVQGQMAPNVPEVIARRGVNIPPGAGRHIAASGTSTAVNFRQLAPVSDVATAQRQIVSELFAGLHENAPARMLPVINRYGITLGELAELYNGAVAGLKENLHTNDQVGECRLGAHIKYMMDFVKGVACQQLMAGTISQGECEDFIRSCNEGDFTITYTAPARRAASPVQPPPLGQQEKIPCLVDGVLGTGEDLRPSKWYGVLKFFFGAIAWVPKLFGAHPFDAFERWKARRVDLSFVAATVRTHCSVPANKVALAGINVPLTAAVKGAIPADLSEEFKNELTARLVGEITNAIPGH